MEDRIIRGTAQNGEIRFFAAITTNLVEKARQIHDCTPVASAALGRMLTGASMMGTMLKNDKDIITLQINGKGPAGSIVTVANCKGIVKGYISNPAIDMPLNSKGKLDVGGAVGKDGNVSVIRDMGLKDPYIGQVPIVSGEIAEDITYYYAVSEQVPSAVSLGVLVDKDYSIISAGGFIVQMMPEASDFTRDIIEFRLNEIPSVTQIIKETGNVEEIIRELLDRMDPIIYEDYHPQFICECSREKIEKVLLSMGKDELTDMADKEESTEVVCHFCNKNYVFTSKELLTLLEDAQKE